MKDLDYTKDVDFFSNEMQPASVTVDAVKSGEAGKNSSSTNYNQRNFSI